MRAASRRRRRSVTLSAALRATILFVAGLGLLVHEATLPAAEVSWPRLVIFAGMMGGPFAAWADTARRAAEALRQPQDQE